LQFLRFCLVGVHLSLLHQSMMDLLTVVSCSLLPIGHRSFIYSIGMHNGLNWTAIRKQDDDDDHQFCCSAQSFHHRPSSRAKGLFTRAATRALRLIRMNANVARPYPASCGTRRIRANLFRRIHRLCCTVLHKHIMPGTVDFFKLFLSFHRLVGLYLIREARQQLDAITQPRQSDCDIKGAATRQRTVFVMGAIWDQINERFADHRDEG